MAFNGSGVFNRLYTWITDRDNGVKIQAQRMDDEMDGMATGLSNCITKDGQTTVTANIPMNSKKLTGLAYGTTLTDSLAWGQARERLVGNRTYYVRTDGSDSNTGLLNTAGGAFLTIQKAVDTINAGLEFDGFVVDIQCADGTYSGNVLLQSKPPGMTLGYAIRLMGNIVTPTNVIVSGNVVVGNIFGEDGQLYAQGVKFQSPAGMGVAVYGNSSFVFENVHFGACLIGQIRLQNSCYVRALGTYYISGSSPYHVDAEYGGTAIIHDNTIVFSNAPAFSVAFLIASFGGQINADNMVFTNGGTVTGSRFIASGPGSVIVAGGPAGSYLPGNVVGLERYLGRYVDTTAVAEAGLPVSSGGTGITAGTSGGIPYYSSTSTIASSAALTSRAVIVGGGAGATPAATGVTIDVSNNLLVTGTAGVQGAATLSAAVNTIGGGGTSGTSSLALNGALGTNLGFQLIWEKNGTPNWYMGQDSGIGAGGLSTANDMVLYSASSGSVVLKVGYAAGAISFPGVLTTASAANAFLDNAASNNLLRSTSSLRYKTNVEPVDDEYADAILRLNPIWYRSLAPADNPEWSWYGLGAEDVAEIDPRLVHWTYADDAYETVDEYFEVPEKQEVDQIQIVIEDGAAIKKTVKVQQQKMQTLPVMLENGEPSMMPDGAQEMISVPVMSTEIRQRRQLKAGAVKVPDGVQYERLAVLLLSIVKRMKASG